MLAPVFIGGRRLSLLKRFEHLQVLLIDLLDLFFASAEIKGSRSTRHWNKHGALPCVLLLLTAHLIGLYLTCICTDQAGIWVDGKLIAHNIRLLLGHVML